MFHSGSPTDPKKDGAGKAAAVKDVETSAAAPQYIDVGRHASDDARMTHLIHEYLSKFFTILKRLLCRRLPPAKMSPFPAGAIPALKART
eukprot:jgi/Tetstr1/447873/TSEL_035182.t1